LKLDGESVIGGAAGDDGLGCGAGGVEREVRVGGGTAGAYGDELRGRDAGGEVGASSVERGEGVYARSDGADREDGVSGWGERRGEESGCAIEKSDGTGGVAGGRAGNVNGECDRRADVGSGDEVAEGHDGGGRTDGEGCRC